MDLPRERPGPEHPIALMRRGQRVVVTVDGAAIADSIDTVLLAEAGHAPVHYFPARDIAPAALKPNPRTSYCPYKGHASYFDIGAGRENGAWSYGNPFDAVAQIAGHVAFDPALVDSIEIVPFAVGREEDPPPGV